MIAVANESCAPIIFQPSQPLTLGVEVEVQLIDWKTLELCPAAPRLLRTLKPPTFHPEYFQSNLEMVTGVCPSLHEVEQDLRRAGRELLKAADPLGVDIVGVGTHPFEFVSQDVV